MRFLLVLLTVYFPFFSLQRVQSLNCNPAANSSILLQCFETNNGHIALLSGHRYTISDNRLTYYPGGNENGILTLNSTESNKPATLVLKDIKKEGLFTNGSMIVNNLDIRGEGPGVFLMNVNKIEISNCSVSNYYITDSSTSFIQAADRLELSNTRFYNNTVHSATSSIVSPAFVIGSNEDQDNWNITIWECTFERNSMPCEYTILVTLR